MKSLIMLTEGSKYIPFFLCNNILKSNTNVWQNSLHNCHFSRKDFKAKKGTVFTA